jgi:hypothetical protein
MVAWWWLLVAIFVTWFITVLAMSLCVVSGRADESSYFNIDYPERPR